MIIRSHMIKENHFPKCISIFSFSHIFSLDPSDSLCSFVWRHIVCSGVAGSGTSCSQPERYNDKWNISIKDIPIIHIYVIQGVFYWSHLKVSARKKTFLEKVKAPISVPPKNIKIPSKKVCVIYGTKNILILEVYGPYGPDF